MLFRFLPDLIKGDLDSLRDDVRDFYVAQVIVEKFHGSRLLQKAKSDVQGRRGSPRPRSVFNRSYEMRRRACPEGAQGRHPGSSALYCQQGLSRSKNPHNSTTS